LPAQGLLQVVHLESHMRDGLDEVRIGRTLPVPLPLDAEGIVLMVTHRDSQVGKIDFPFKASRCGDANVIELHSASPSNREPLALIGFGASVPSVDRRSSGPLRWQKKMSCCELFVEPQFDANRRAVG